MLENIKDFFNSGSFIHFWIRFFEGLLISFALFVVFIILLLFISIFIPKLKKSLVGIAFSIYRKWNSAPRTRNVIIMATLLFLILVFLFLSPTKDLWPEFFGALTSTLTTIFIGYIGFLIVIFFEDRHKVSNSIDYLSGYYGLTYKTTLEINKGSIEFMYDICDENINNVKFQAFEEAYKLPEFIEGNFQTIFSAHKGSYKKNSSMFRVKNKSVNDNLLILNYQKTTFYNHLVTNRAIDLSINKAVTIRDLFEFGPILNDLNESVLSNHLGVIGIIETKDGSFIFNHRAMNATTSKNKFVSSFAFGLKYNETNLEEYKDSDYIFNEVKKKIKSDLAINPKDIEEKKIIGFGRDVHEGGKPNIFIYLKLNINDNQVSSNYKGSLDSVKDANLIDRNNTTILVKKDKILIGSNDLILIGSKLTSKGLVYDRMQKSVEINLLALLKVLKNKNLL